MSDINIKCINEIVQALVDVCWVFAWGLRPLLLLVNWKIYKERNSRTFQQKESSALDLVQKIQEEARIWGLAGAKFLIALIVGA